MLVQDKVVLSTGRLSAKDRNGAIGDELKVLAEDVKEVTLQLLEAYQPTGSLLPPPVAVVKSKRKSMAAKAEAAVKPKVIYRPVEEPLSLDEEVAPSQKLYVHIKNPGDHEALLKLKQTFNQYPGESEVILVLGNEKKSAIRLPFTVTLHDELQQQLVGLYGQDCIALK